MRSYVIVIIYPPTLERRVLEWKADNRADIEARLSVQYPKWWVQAIKEVNEDA